MPVSVRQCDGVSGKPISRWLRFDSIVSIRNIQDQFDNWKLAQAVPEGIALLQSFNQHVQQTQPWKIMIAEDLQGDARLRLH